MTVRETSFHRLRHGQLPSTPCILGIVKHIENNCKNVLIGHAHTVITHCLHIQTTYTLL